MREQLITHNEQQLPVEIQTGLENIRKIWEAGNSSEQVQVLISRMNSFGEIKDRHGQVTQVDIGKGGGRPAFCESELRLRHFLEDEVIAGFAGSKGPSMIAEDGLRRITSYGLGVTVEQNAAGLIVTYEGTDPTMQAVAIGGHTDTIKQQAGPMDGQLNVAEALLTLKTIIKSGVRPERTIKLLLVTGEDNFLYSFLGSILMTRGLKDAKELDAPIDIGCTVREALMGWAKAFDIPNFQPEKLIGKPLLDTSSIRPFIELHADPTTQIKEQGAAIAATEKIMGADRWTVDIGFPRMQEVKLAVRKKAIHLRIKGPGGHSASDMDKRTDIMPYAMALLEEYHKMPISLRKKVNVHVVDVVNHGQSLAKISSDISEVVLLDSEDQTLLDAAATLLQRRFQREQEEQLFNHLHWPKSYPDTVEYQWKEFDGSDNQYLMNLEVIKEPLINTVFMWDKIQEFTRRVKTVSEWEYINRTGCVGTVTMIERLANGQIRLGLDVRGFNLELRYIIMKNLFKELGRVFQIDWPNDLYYDNYPKDPKEALVKIAHEMNRSSARSLQLVPTQEKQWREQFDRDFLDFPNLPIPVKINYPLPGSEAPAVMSGNLGSLIEAVAAGYGIKYGPRLAVRAGEDAIVYPPEWDKQMIFVAATGGAHNPNEHVEPEVINQGGLVLAGVTYILANLK